MRRIAITTGDADGVGPEVTAKALRSLGPLRGVRFIVYRTAHSEKLFRPLRRQFGSSLVEVVSDSPVDWVQEAGEKCLQGEYQGMVTGPLSKTLIRSSGRQELGHTEILSKLSGAKSVFQAYLGSHFHVVLATAHMPLRRVSQALSSKKLHQALLASAALAKRLSLRKPLGVLGLNPHSGESGLLGPEEGRMKAVLKRFRAHPVEGPLVPDAAFAKSRWDRYSVYVSCYHDQGLIPFKLIHGQSEGAQVSLGLPFVRTSVDHGTAKDIAGRGVADPGSMKDAIRWALRLTKGMKCTNQ